MIKLISRIALLALAFLVGSETYAIDVTKLNSRYMGVKSSVKAMKHELGDVAIPLKSTATKPTFVKASKDPIMSVSAVPGWGFLTGPDGSDWFYSQTYVVDGWYYTSSEIVIYNNTQQEVGRFEVEVPEGEFVNQIMPFGEVTDKFFDKDSSSCEIAVFNHAVTEDYKGKMWVDIYSLGGEKIRTIDCEAAMFVNASHGWTSYMRLITAQTDENGVVNINILRSPGWDSDEMIIDHTFTVDEKLINYMDASYINYYVIDGQLYYVIPHYEKEYMIYNDDIFAEPIPTEDNSFIVEVYNDKYEEVTTLNIPMEKNENAYYTFSGFGMFSDFDLSKGLFTGDDQLNFIITEYDYMLESDDYLYSFNVYNQDGEFLKTIGENIATWRHLSSLTGFENQVAFIKTDTENGSIDIVNIPSCQKTVTLPGEIDGRMISSNMDRCRVGDSYQFVISIAQGFYDDNNNVISSIGWYTPDGAVDHYVDFNIGTTGEYFSAYISPEVLNPYLVDTDDEYEYVYMTKTRNSDDTLTNNLYISNEDGSVIRCFTSHPRKGAYYSGGFINWQTTTPVLFIAYTDDDFIYSVDFYDMPFEKFANGGIGTEADPYQISTVGDLRQITNDPSAHYVLCNSIDMEGFDWSAIQGFSGNLDGKNHVIRNLKLQNNDNYCSFFATLEENAVVKNLIFDSPSIEIGNQNYFVGVLAGVTTSATIENVHVLNGTITGDNTATIGGLIANPTYYTSIKSCSVRNMEIYSPTATPLGGLCGDTRTGTTVDACYVSGTFTGSSEVGGVVGTTGKDCTVTDCHVVADIVAKRSVGGIIGSAERAAVSNNIAEGSVEATEMNMLGISGVGGIIGYLTSDWSNKTAGNKLFVGNIANMAVKSLSEAKAVGRIIGRTIVDENYEDGEEVKTEQGLENNYAGAGATINGVTIVSEDAASVNGADIDLTTVDKEFYEGIGYLFGSDAANPWKLVDNAMEIYYIGEIMSLSFDKALFTAEEDTMFDLTATVYGADASEITFSVSDESIVEIVDTEIFDNTVILLVKLLSVGSATITAECGGLKEECVINAMSGIEEIVENGDVAAHNVYAINGEIVVTGEYTSVEVYNMAGVRFNTLNVPAGFYVVRVDGKTYKVAVR